MLGNRLHHGVTEREYFRGRGSHLMIPPVECRGSRLAGDGDMEWMRARLPPVSSLSRPSYAIQPAASCRGQLLNRCAGDTSIGEKFGLWFNSICSTLAFSS